MTELLNKITQGDCLEVMQRIPDGSVDMILCDPPYGNMKGAQLDGWSNATTEWDMIINTDSLFEQYERILRENGVVVLFSQEPYTTELRTHRQNNLEFSYPKYWRKDHFANALIAKKAPVSYIEDISIFHKAYDRQLVNPLRKYFRQLFEWIDVSKRELIEIIGQRVDHTFRFDSMQFKLCTRETYDALIERFKLNSFEGFIPYDELVDLNGKYNRTFNLEGATFKPNVLDFKKDYEGLHPTQKPVALFEYLIRTYTNEGEIVLDNCIGSGTTAVAAINTNRQFIGIEKEPEYVEIGNRRIAEAMAEKEAKD